MSHDEFAGMAAGYAISALDPDELKLFEAHLASCPECQAAVADLRPLVDALSMMNPEAEPVSALRERILASPSPLATSPPAKRHQRSWPPGGVDRSSGRCPSPR